MKRGSFFHTSYHPANGYGWNNLEPNNKGLSIAEYVMKYDRRWQHSTEAAWKGVAEGAMMCQGVQGAVTLARYMAWKLRDSNQGRNIYTDISHLYTPEI